MDLATVEELLDLLSALSCGYCFQRVFLGYAQTWRASTLTTKANTSEQLHEMARARGVRLIKAIEYGQECKLDEEAIKVLTGGDTIVGRHLYHNAFEYVPQFKVWMGTITKNPWLRGWNMGSGDVSGLSRSRQSLERMTPRLTKILLRNLRRIPGHPELDGPGLPEVAKRGVKNACYN